MQKPYTSQWALLGNSKAALPFINTPRADNTLLWININPALGQKVRFCVMFSCISHFLPGALKPPLESILCELNWVLIMKTIVCLTVNRIHREHKALWYFITVLWLFDLPPCPGVCSSWWALTARREHQSWEKMSFGIDWSGSPHAYTNVTLHEEAREHSSCIIVLKCAKEGKGKREVNRLRDRERGRKLGEQSR